jgi:hypothetical protein
MRQMRGSTVVDRVISPLGKATSIKFSAVLIAVLALSFGVFADSAPADASGSVTILPAGHTWEYTFVDPTADPTWNESTGVWAAGAAPFGVGGSGLTPVTPWPADTNGFGSVIVDVDAVANHLSETPVALNLPAGTYQFTVIGTSEGGAFDAWDAWGFGTGWLTAYRFSTSAGISDVEHNGVFATPQLAREAATDGVTVTLPTAETVYFSNADVNNGDNSGGVSIRVSNGDDLWVRTEIDLTGYDLSTVSWDLGVDNGFTLFANGTPVGSGAASGGTTEWEYSGGFGDSLVAGPNVIAVALNDWGGATGFDMQITGELDPAALIYQITQGSNTWLVTAVTSPGENAAQYYSYDTPMRSSSNIGTEVDRESQLFLYLDEVADPADLPPSNESS